MQDLNADDWLMFCLVQKSLPKGSLVLTFS